MKALIKETAGADYTHDNFNDTLRALRGTWVEVDTSYLFNDQYNLKGYNLRILDKHIAALQDDERAGMVKCGYCGKQFKTAEELQAHYVEMDASAHDCENCTDYANGLKDIIREKVETADDEGNKIVTETTKYIYGKKCRWDACNKFEHRNHKPKYFTPENTYFLKYPNGYVAFFLSLPIADQWKELGYTWDAEQRTATKLGAAGTYDAILKYSENGKIESATLKNTRHTATFTAEHINTFFSNYFAIQYHMRFDENGKDRELLGYSTMPKAQQTAIETYFGSLRDGVRNAVYKHDLILGKD